MEPRTTQWFNTPQSQPAAIPAVSTDGESATMLRGPDDTEPASVQPVLAIGGSIGKYEIRQQLGEGGQARTLLAYDPDLRREVVIKFYHAVQDAADREMVLNEGRALAQVRSPFVAQCYGADRHEGVPYLVLEYIPGSTLAALHANQRLDVPRALALISQIADGVSAIHRGGLLHLDLKPSNIMIDQAGHPRIVDFGLATTIGSERLRRISGTPAYMAPEQARGECERIDVRADVFGLGAVLYELLTGRPPYQGESQLSTWTLAKAGNVVPAITREPKLPAAVNDLCMRCLANEPSARWPSADELRTALAEFDPNRKKGFGFRLQWGRFKLQLSIGISLAGLFLMVGAMAWMESGVPRGSEVALGTHKTELSEPTPPEQAPFSFEESAMMGGTGLADTKSMPEPAGPLELRHSAASAAKHSDKADLPLRKNGVPSPGGLQDAADHRFKRDSNARRDFALQVELVGALRKEENTTIVPADQPLRLQVSSDRACYFGAWLVRDNGVVEQIVPNEFDTDTQLVAAAARAVPANNDQSKKATYPSLKAGEKSQVIVLAHTDPLPAEFRADKGLRRWVDEQSAERWKLAFHKLSERPGKSANDQPGPQASKLIIPVQGEEQP